MTNYKSKKVLFLESSNNIGGQELQLLQQMQELNQRGWQTKLLCRPQARIYEFAIAKGMDVLAVDFRNALHIPSIKLVAKEIAQLKPLALICHSGHDSIVAAMSVKFMRISCRPKLIRMRTYQPGMPSSFPYNYLFDITYANSEHLRKKILKNKKINQSKVVFYTRALILKT